MWELGLEHVAVSDPIIAEKARKRDRSAVSAFSDGLAGCISCLAGKCRVVAPQDIRSLLFGFEQDGFLGIPKKGLPKKARWLTAHSIKTPRSGPALARTLSTSPPRRLLSATG
jgi:hypothetical protein